MLPAGIEMEAKRFWRLFIYVSYPVCPWGVLGWEPIGGVLLDDSSDGWAVSWINFCWSSDIVREPPFWHALDIIAIN